MIAGVTVLVPKHRTILLTRHIRLLIVISSWDEPLRLVWLSILPCGDSHPRLPGQLAEGPCGKTTCSPTLERKGREGNLAGGWQ